VENYTDDIYEVLDELNVQIEETISECTNPDAMELIIPILRQQAHFFVENFREEIAKIELIET
jgi:hypothetical protein